MVVRWALLGTRVGMREDAKTQFWVLIENFALWHIVAKMRRDEVLVLQHLLQKCTHLLPACRAGIGLESTVTRGSKLFEGV